MVCRLVGLPSTGDPNSTMSACVKGLAVPRAPSDRDIKSPAGSVKVPRPPIISVLRLVLAIPASSTSAVILFTKDSCESPSTRRVRAGCPNPSPTKRPRLVMGTLPDQPPQIIGYRLARKVAKGTLNWILDRGLISRNTFCEDCTLRIRALSTLRPMGVWVPHIPISSRTASSSPSISLDPNVLPANCRIFLSPALPVTFTPSAMSSTRADFNA